jgi:putative CocE/NonD family hydrolase
MPDVTNVELQWGVRIPLRDGTELGATLYLPRNQTGPAPVLVTLTPYVSDTSHERGTYFAAHGYPCAIVDVRGRGNSGGIFEPMTQEAKDGFDVVEWLAGQVYCNGKVAMLGGSYLGYCQWATAKEFPPHLATIVPAAALYPAVDFPMRNNIFYPFLVQWLTLTAGHAAQARIFSDGELWSALFRRWHESGRCFREIDAMCGNPSSIFQRWIGHPEPDEYWDSHAPTEDDYARLQIPVLTITGSYDDDQPGALEYYKWHMRHGAPPACSTHYLVIGPWDHAGTRTPAASFGGLELGPASLVDLSKLHLEWYAWTMKSGARPAFLKKPVAYYVMAAEKWRYADTLSAITARHVPYFLDSVGGNAADVFCAGSLQTSVGTGAPDRYAHDPHNVTGPEVEAEARASGSSLVDQSVTLALCGKQLVYHSAPFDTATEISGFFKLTAWLAIDTPDADFYVSVHEIRPDGSSVRLSTDAVRARYREGLRVARLVGTTEPLRYEFERFTFVSRVIGRGHRLRLVIAPMGRLVETTFAQKNYLGGGVVAEESEQDARSVTVSLFHDAAHPSVLYIPIGQPESGDAD